MKKLLVIAVAVSLCASVASAGTYYPIRDSGINKACGSTWCEAHTNMGAITQCRFMKGRQHFLLMDFDWAAIEAEMLANPTYYARFSMVPVNDDAQYRWISLQLSENSTDWIEADGASQFTEFNWTDPTVNYAVTSQYSQTIGMDDGAGGVVVDPTNSAGSWPWGDFDGKRLRPGYRNAYDLTLGVGGGRTYTVLHKAWLQYLFDGNTPDGGPSVGFYTFDSGNFFLNAEAYTSDAGQALSPRIDVMPEPASMLLIGLGGIGLLLRKRR